MKKGLLTNILGVDALVLLFGHHVLGQLDMGPCADKLVLLVDQLDAELDLCFDSRLCALARDACDVHSETMFGWWREKVHGVGKCVRACVSA